MRASAAHGTFTSRALPAEPIWTECWPHGTSSGELPSPLTLPSMKMRWPCAYAGRIKTPSFGPGFGRSEGIAAVAVAVAVVVVAVAVAVVVAVAVAVVVAD